MPVFRTAPSSDLGSAIRRAVASSNLGPMGEIQADMAAASTAKNMGLAEKARAEVEQMQRAEDDRRNPQLATEYAGNVAGLDAPTATRLSDHLRGVLEQPGAGDIDDAMVAGKEAQPYVTGAPNVSDGQRRGFQTALASLIANRLATGKTNADQLAQGGAVLNQTALQNEATDATTVPDQNRLVAAMAGKVREPYKTNAQGTVLNEETGALNDSTPLANAVRQHIAAQTTQATAAASASNARAAATKEAGAKGWTMYKDKDNGLLRFNANAGLTQKRGADGNWEEIDELPEGVTKLGTQGSALNQRFSGRVIGAANEGYAAINSIAKLSDPQSGLFSAKAMSGAEGKGVIAGIFTPERVKRYNATIAGLSVEIATAQNQGMVPNDKQIAHVEEAITIGPTDDDVTKRYRVALAARYIRKGLEVSMDLANPDQKKRAQGLMKDLEKIPDPDEIETENKGAGMFPKAVASPAALKPTNAKGWKLMKDAKGNQAYVGPNNEIEEVK